eukprot:CAMPEP_0205806432 /NCGR_PEP_ID=MMETSP0205-20121125/10001_1 /ASSEMBLY_ACC=CAM_ASM_000278 /TAXON_ID=36767 /ORGANISM="Euplotes focardii, Strain TN1" /LENGTH=177 /DNA_ID=CAMNT_0053079335 /DNA_START=335 /DNA_END=868 /DNA_ORIENTATION=+
MAAINIEDSSTLNEIVDDFGINSSMYDSKDESSHEVENSLPARFEQPKLASKESTPFVAYQDKSSFKKSRYASIHSSSKKNSTTSDSTDYVFRMVNSRLTITSKGRNSQSSSKMLTPSPVKVEKARYSDFFENLDNNLQNNQHKGQLKKKMDTFQLQTIHENQNFIHQNTQSSPFKK